MRGLARLAIGAASAVAIMLPAATASATSAHGALAHPASAFTVLNLKNGWTAYGFGTSRPRVAKIGGVVYFKGAMRHGHSAFAFTLPPALRPATTVYVLVDLCNANKGRLHIQRNGVVQVQAEGGVFSNARCFTSLDGVSFVQSAKHLTALKLQHGWRNAPYRTSAAEVVDIGGIVHFKGAISSGSSSVVFTLPTAFRPATRVYVPVDLCGASKGRLYIQPTGVVEVQEETSFSAAHCFTSLDGASFAKSASHFTALTLENGWVNAPFGTSSAKVATIGGIVHFKGAISSGTNSLIFTLPKAFRPGALVYVPVDLCNANNGRMDIYHSGAVYLEEEGGTFSHATCFTSLDGAWFKP